MPAAMMSSSTPTWMEGSNYNGSWTVEGFEASSSTSSVDVDGKVGVGGGKIQINQTQKTIKELLYNGTGYYIEDEMETGFNDFQTVVLACIATLLSLAAFVFTVFGIRILWQRYKTRKENCYYDGMLPRDGTSESIARPLHSHLLEDKSFEGHLSLNSDGIGTCGITEVNSQIHSNSHSSTNGSIITMTLKNNHLIVETEERNDIEEDSRETKMKYNPAARDGVFVVEVQQGVRRSPGSGTLTCVEAEVSVSNQCALVHSPPDRYSDEETLEECDDSEYYVDTISPNRQTPDSLTSQAKTGLAQSNTSLCHQSYCYTNQQGYENGCYGYSTCTGYEHDGISRLPEDTNLPKITAAIYKCTLKRSPSSEDLCLAAAGVPLTDDKKVVNKNINEIVRQESIPEETFYDISPTKTAGREIIGNESYRKLDGDTRVQIDNYKNDIGMDEIKTEIDIVKCK